MITNGFKERCLHKDEKECVAIFRSAMGNHDITLVIGGDNVRIYASRLRPRSATIISFPHFRVCFTVYFLCAKVNVSSFNDDACNVLIEFSNCITRITHYNTKRGKWRKKKKNLYIIA